VETFARTFPLVALAALFTLAPAGCRRAHGPVTVADAGPPGVRVHIPLHGGPLGSHEERDLIYALSDRVHAAVDPADAGDVDGNEFGGGECVMFVHGGDPARVWTLVEPVLRAAEFTHGGHAELHGGRGPDRRVEF
jgi:hypothetical protein